MKLSTIATAVALALTWTTSLKAEEAPAKKGLSFVPFPMLAYDGAKGFLVGGMLNVYDFGIRMDKYRIMATASYCADKSMSFYGYDGYNSFYDSALDESSVVSVSLFLAWRVEL